MERVMEEYKTNYLEELSWDELWSRYPNQLKKLDKLQNLLGYCFVNIALLYESLTHRSATVINQSKSKTTIQCNPDIHVKWNERIEFLGDSVLGLVISTHLWSLKEQYTEGHLSKIRSSLVNEQSLAEIARNFELGDVIILGRGEEKSGGRDRDALLADALEALIGAIYVDGGFETASRVIHTLFEEKLKHPFNGMKGDAKTQLQEWAQEKYRCTPEYKLISEHGPDHAKEFEVGVYLGQQVLATGKGLSKKRASQSAAGIALKDISRTNQD